MSQNVKIFHQKKCFRFFLKFPKFINFKFSKTKRPRYLPSKTEVFKKDPGFGRFRTFDEIIIFETLTKYNFKDIISIQLQELSKRVESHSIK